ncbi:MAG: type I restriction endonuclease [Janthinobacterium lividum]
MNVETGKPNAVLRALHLLSVIGWTYVAPEICLARRGGKRHMLLESTLIELLRTRRFEYRNQWHPLSASAIDQIVRELSNVSLHDGLLEANQRLHEKLVHGITVTEFMADGSKHHPTIMIIDWRNPAENRFEMSDRFEVLPEQGLESRTLDMVGFVNGIPLVVLASGRGDSRAAIAQGIAKQLVEQRPGGVPMVYAYAQMLLAVSNNDGVYGTTLATPERWCRWREEEFGDAHFARLEKNATPTDALAAFDSANPAALQTALRQLWPAQGVPSGLERLLVGLMTPARLLAFIRSFLIFDREKGKLAARCAQFFAARAVLARVGHRRIGGLRDGGVLWHKNGTGKSTLLLVLINTLLLQDTLKSCRIVVITDSTSLRDRLVMQFMKRDAFDPVTGLMKRKPKVLSGRNLAGRIGSGNERVVIASVQKFTIAAELAACRNFSDNLIVITEESQRRQFVENRRRLRKALPRAAWIALSGEPLQPDRAVGEYPGTLIHAYPLDEVNSTGAPLEMRQTVEQYSVGSKSTLSLPGSHGDSADGAEFIHPHLDSSADDGQGENWLNDEMAATAAALATLTPETWMQALAPSATDGAQYGMAAFERERQSQLIDEAVRVAVTTNSLNPQNIETAVRRSLLPELSAQAGLEKAKEMIEEILKILRERFGRSIA